MTTKAYVRMCHILDAASATVSKMDPAWVASTKAWLLTPVNPCRRPSACDTAQTCIGGCDNGRLCQSRIGMEEGERYH
jgi:hypothetical protein